MRVNDFLREYGDVPVLTIRVRDLAPVLQEQERIQDPVWLLGRLRDEMTAYLPEILEGMWASLQELLYKEEPVAHAS